MKKYLALICILCVSLFLISLEAQCPMCRVAAESNLKYGGETGRGLNFGILYMLSLPYILILTIGIKWYQSNKAVFE